MINVQFKLAKRFEEQTQLFHEFKKLFAFLFRAENKVLQQPRGNYNFICIRGYVKIINESYFTF